MAAQSIINSEVGNSAAKGFLATLPLTLVMFGVKRYMTGKFRPIPPDLVTRGILRQTGTRPHAGSPQYEIFTWLSHFGFGTLAGSLWPFFSRTTQFLPRSIRGPLFGLAVWWVNYNVVFPRLGVVRHTKHAPKDRNIELILSHLVWGYLMSRKMPQQISQRN